MEKVSAIIPAAGSGRRIGSAIRKQFLKLRGKPLLVYTLEAFERCPDIDDIILVIPREDKEFSLKGIAEKYGISKLRRAVAGGDERQESVYNGLMTLGCDTSIAVIHDAVRPFIGSEDISGAISLCEECGAVVTAVPVSDTVKVSDGETVERTLDRGRLWLAQTPQVFRKDWIRKAYREAEEQQISATDDAFLVEQLGHPIKIVQGEEQNIKITSAMDLFIAEKWIDERLR